MFQVEIDAERRELRAGDRKVTPQPKVFELLAYLAQHRERVVPKRELLEAVWPGVIVTDASLQRAISLARAALAELGVPDAIRTYARQGYRYVADELPHAEASPEPLASDGAGASVLERAQRAYEAGAWEEAIAAFREVDDLEGLRGDDLQRWAHAAQCLGRPAEALPVLERAVAAYSARGDARRAAWACLLSASLRAEWGERALANGWLQRAARLLEGQPECLEQGYLASLRARLRLTVGEELEAALDHALRALELGRRFGDADLEGLALMQAGQAWLFSGKTREGLDALDEAGVAVGACGLSPWAGGLVYCGVIFSYMTRADWQRAGEWTEEFTRWCEGKGVDAYPGLCRMHRAEVLALRGRLDEAQREMEATVPLFAAHAPWAQGDGFAVLGDILLARGALAEARAAYVRASELGWDTTFGLALVRYYEGDARGALRQLSQCIHEQGFSCRSRPGLSLAYLVIVASAAGELAEARAALERLRADPALGSTPALEALVTRAEGELCFAAGDAAGALSWLRQALGRYRTLGAPLACAEVRRELARVLIAQGELEGAAVELGAAQRLFEQAGADEQVKLGAALWAELEQARSGRA